MTPERLRSWLDRNRVGASALRLRHLELGNPEGGTVFQVWQVENLPENLVQEIFDASGDYADSIEEAARIAVEYVNEGGDAIAATIHKAKTPEAHSNYAKGADGVSTNALIFRLLGHIEVQQKVLSGGNLGAFQVLEKALTLQNKIVDRQAEQIRTIMDQLVEARRGQVAAAVGDDETVLALAAESEEESRARARAMERFSELLPTVASMLLSYMEAKANANGHAAPAAG